MNSEVLIYLQQMKMYIENNPTAKEYFIGEFHGDMFYKKLEEISLINYENTNDPKLNREQLESVRSSLRETPRNNNNNDLFFEINGYGLVCKN